nr:MAG TPA: hypothetical protein [Caudoviricetes sp.]
MIGFIDSNKVETVFAVTVCYNLVRIHKRTSNNLLGYLPSRTALFHYTRLKAVNFAMSVQPTLYPEATVVSARRAIHLSA